MPKVLKAGHDEDTTAVNAVDIAAPTETVKISSQASLLTRAFTIVRQALETALSLPQIDTQVADTKTPPQQQALTYAKTLVKNPASIVAFTDGWPADRTWAASHGWKDPHAKETATKEANAG